MTKEENLKLVSLAAEILKYYASPSSFLEYNNLLNAEIILINNDERSKQAAEIISTEISRATGKSPLIERVYVNLLTPCSEHNKEFFRKRRFDKKTIIIASQKGQTFMIEHLRNKYEVKEFPFQILSLEQILESKYQKIKEAMLTGEFFPKADTPKFKDLSPEGVLGENFKVSLKRAASIMFLADDYPSLVETAAIFQAEKRLKNEKPRVICLNNIDKYQDYILSEIMLVSYLLKIDHKLFSVEKVQKSQVSFSEENIVRKILKCYVPEKNNIIVLSAQHSVLVDALKLKIVDAGLALDDFSFCIINPPLQNLTARQVYLLLAHVYQQQKANPKLEKPENWDEFDSLARKFNFVQPGKYKTMWYNYLEYRRACHELENIKQHYKAYINKI